MGVRCPANTEDCRSLLLVVDHSSNHCSWMLDLRCAGCGKEVAVQVMG